MTKHDFECYVSDIYKAIGSGGLVNVTESTLGGLSVDDARAVCERHKLKLVVYGEIVNHFESNNAKPKVRQKFLKWKVD